MLGVSNDFIYLQIHVYFCALIFETPVADQTKHYRGGKFGAHIRLEYILKKFSIK